jgi:hypothetical protein
MKDFELNRLNGCAAITKGGSFPIKRIVGNEV